VRLKRGFEMTDPGPTIVDRLISMSVKAKLSVIVGALMTMENLLVSKQGSRR